MQFLVRARKNREKRSEQKMTSTKTTTMKTNHYFRALVTAVVAILLALSSLSAPAVGEQSADLEQNGPGSNNKDAAVSLASSTTTPKAFSPQARGLTSWV
jgi:hypothetical protein